MIVRVLCLAALLAGLAQGAQADKAACRHLFQSMPHRLGALPENERVDYEAKYPGLGYSVSYVRADKTEATTVYFYDGAVRAPTDKDLRRSFEESAVAMRAEPRLGGMAEMRAFSMTPPAHGMSYAADGTDGKGRGQILLMGLHGTCIVKLRYTGPGGRDAALRRIGAALSALDAVLAR